MSQQPVTLPPSVNGSKSLEKLFVYIISRGSVITANAYVGGAKKFAQWAGSAPDRLLSRKRNWGAMLNDYITDAAQQGKSSSITSAPSRSRGSRSPLIRFHGTALGPAEDNRTAEGPASKLKSKLPTEIVCHSEMSKSTEEDVVTNRLKTSQSQLMPVESETHGRRRFPFGFGLRLGHR